MRIFDSSIAAINAFFYDDQAVNAHTFWLRLGTVFALFFGYPIEETSRKLSSTLHY